MKANAINRLVMSASLLGASSLLAACGSSGNDSEETASAAGSGGSALSSDTGAGGAPTPGAEANTPSSTCPMGPEITPVVWTGAGDAGAEGTAAILCYPDIVCFGPAVPTPGMSFVNSAFVNMSATSAGAPFAANESGLATAKVSYPEPGKVCMSGDDGARFELYLGSGVLWDGVNLPDPNRGPGLFQAGALGITAVSFTIETPPSTGVTLGVITFPPPCGALVGADAVEDGNPRVFTSSTTTATLSFATDFTQPFDTNAIDGLNFNVGQGPYDYCITDLKFLDANGDEVTP